MELNQFNTHDRIFVFHNQRPSYSCSGGVHFPFHRTANHFRKFPMSMCHLCTRRIGHSCLGERRPNGIQIKTIVKLHKNEKNSKDNRSLLIVPVRQRALGNLVRERRELKIEIHINSWFHKKCYKTHDNFACKCQQINQFCVEWLHTSCGCLTNRFHSFKFIMLSTLLAIQIIQAIHHFHNRKYRHTKKKVNQLKRSAAQKILL